MVSKEKIDLLDFDLYSRRISFYYNNKEKFGTTFGFILTVLYIALSLIIFLIYFTRTLQRKEVRSADSTIYPNGIPSIDINNDIFYIAFGIEHPTKSTRFIDERIYYPEVLFIEKIKENGEFVIKKETTLNVERCSNIKFGKNYQNLIARDELNNSYCLKDFNLTLEGGTKYNVMSYIKINLYPCVNKTENNNYCKPKNIIDEHLTSTYFSILVKDIGFNPLNYSFPAVPIIQYLHTSVDKSVLKEYIMYFGITEIDTDIGLFLNRVKKETYIKYMRDFHSFFFTDNEQENKGKEIFTSQIRLEDTILFHKRTFTKMSEVFSLTGGYMQVISTVLALIALLTKKFSLEQKLLNCLFNFNIKQRKIILCIEYKKKLDYNYTLEKGTIRKNTFILYEPKKSIISRKSKRDSFLILNKKKKIAQLKRSVTFQNPNMSVMKDIQSKNSSSKDWSSSIFKNIPKEKEQIGQKEKNEQNEQRINIINEQIDPNINRSKVNMIYKEDDLNLNGNMSNKKVKKRMSNFNIINDLSILDQGRRSTVNFNIFDYYCLKKINKKKTEIDLFNFGINFFKSQMDIINFFNILILTQIMLTQQTDKKQNILTRNIELSMD